jgi:hypothetical protein
MLQSFNTAFVRTKRATAAKIQGFLNRRPHRSFRLTRRRDYIRALEIPGYWKFTNEVRQILWSSKKIFGWLAIVYAVLTAALIGVASQESYAALTTTLQETGSEIFTGQWGQIGQAGLLFATIATNGLSGTVSEAQQIYTALLLLFVWVTTVWLLRQIMAGRQVKLRDGLYNAGSPVIATFLIAGLLLVQLIPVALAIIGYTAAASTGLISGGIEAMLFWIVAILLALLSIYWLTSSFFAMVIVTLPGTYPMQALRTAGDIVIGRRMKILLRMVWLFLGLAVSWALILIPIIILDSAVKSAWTAIAGIPIIPVTLLILSTVSVIWSATYVYLLYRKVVEYDAAS